MKNTIQKGEVHFLIIDKGEGRYLGICKEFGFVEEANSEKEVFNKLVNGTILLLDTVQKNPHLEPSLNVRPPAKYLMLFYVAPLLGALSSIVSRFNGNLKLLTYNPNCAPA